MSSFGGIEILEAEFVLGMCGYFIFRRNEDGKRFRIRHTMSDGKSIDEWIDQDWTQINHRATDEQIVALFPSTTHWTMPTIIAHWSGFAAGQKKGEIKERERRRQRS